ncbi:nucleotidyltransferase family protein [Synechococcus sp. LTW-R]|uniref:nucleotidyltransferase family protein n=1 Tax=Synechococcus sp. LTW-R TaxID=2751170 RepID=UPI00210511FF|nr:nucleotidyltransferase family protein [Synechococcus sp. LTW-R]
MSDAGYQLALVVDDSCKLLGMIADSDIRKALLNGLSLEQEVDSVMNPVPIVVSPCMGESEAHNLMRINHFFHLPVVNHAGQLIGLHVAEHLLSTPERVETVVIMAGGRGQRLMPLTAEIPKPMLPVKGKPMLEHLIEKLSGEGFQNIVISVNYLSAVILDHFGDGSRFGAHISYLHESAPLGTAGSLSLLDPSLLTQHLLVVNCDVLTDVCFADMIDQCIRDSADALMAVRPQEWQNPFGVVRSIGTQFTGLEEKPIVRAQVNAGIYVATPRLLSLLQPGCSCDMTELFLRGLDQQMNLHVFPLHELWLDVGRHSDYETAQEV